MAKSLTREQADEQRVKLNLRPAEVTKWAVKVGWAKTGAWYETERLCFQRPARTVEATVLLLDGPFAPPGGAGRKVLIEDVYLQLCYQFGRIPNELLQDRLVTLT